MANNQKSFDSIYQEVVSLGIEHDHHYSDLYLPVTNQVIDLMDKWDKKANTFISQIDGGSWFDLAFSYDPYWDKKSPGLSQKVNNLNLL